MEIHVPILLVGTGNNDARRKCAALSQIGKILCQFRTQKASYQGSIKIYLVVASGMQHKELLVEIRVGRTWPLQSRELFGQSGIDEAVDRGLKLAARERFVRGHDEY